MITEIVLTILFGLCASGLALLSRVYAYNRTTLPQEHIDYIYPDEKMNSLLAKRDQIEKMRSGYDKLKARERWLEELEIYLANAPKQNLEELSNIIQFRQFR